MKKNICITAMYPLSDEDYISGIFVKEQVEALEATCKDSFDIFNLQKYPSFIRYTFAQLIIMFKLFKYDYANIHIHYAISGLFLLFYKPNSNVVVTFHGSDILIGDGSLKKRVQTYLSKKIAKKADKLILVSDHMKPFLDEFESKSFVIPCGINLDFFKTSPDVQQSQIRVVIFPSNPKRKEKNYILFKSIIERTKLLNPSLNIKELHFINMSRDEIRKSLWVGDCLLLTSISEGSPQVVKEAMACQTPVISRDVGNVKQMLKGVDNSYVVNGDDVEQYAQHLSAILTNRPRSSNSIEALQNLQLDNHSVAQKIAEVYV